MLKHITIHQRLFGGYALILGLAISGTTIGLLIGNHYQRHALDVQQAAVAEKAILSDIQVDISHNRPAQQLSPHLTDATQFRHASQQFLHRVQALQALLAAHHTLHQRIQTGHDMHPGHSMHHDHEMKHGDHPAASRRADSTSEFDVQPLHTLLIDGEKTVEQFYQRTQSFINSIDALGYTPVTLEAAQAEVLAFAQSDEFQAYLTLSKQIEPFIQQADQRATAATIELRHVEQLRTHLILGSLSIAITIAAIVGFYTSRAIAHPLKSITDVAQQVTKDQNFNVRVPVERNDELGILATALNQLMQKVNELLTELQQKNVDVNQALEQLQRQQAQLVQSEKMSSLGQLVAGVAHEINNPVNFIHGNLSHVEEYTEDLLNLLELYQDQYPHATDMIQTAIEDCEFAFIQEDLPKTLSSMHIGTRRIREIVLSLRNFARMDEAELKPADIHDGLNNTLLLLQHRLKASPRRAEIKVIRNYGDIPPIECYAGLLNQVFMNILANAIDALEDKINPAAVSTTTDDTPQIRLQTSLVRGKHGDGLWVKIAIADNGAGMSDQTRQRIFDPFFTTKPIGKGTGMGMSICYQIIHDRHEGRLDCHSTPGQGSTFVIKIPIHPTPSPPSFLEEREPPIRASLDRTQTTV